MLEPEGLEHRPRGPEKHFQIKLFRSCSHLGSRSRRRGNSSISVGRVINRAEVPGNSRQADRQGLAKSGNRMWMRITCAVYFAEGSLGRGTKCAI